MMLSSKSYATPIYSHFFTEDFSDVYEPAEDTFLMIDALEEEAEEIKKLR